MSLKCSEAETQQKEPLPSEKVTTQLHRHTCGRNMSEQHAVYNKDLIPRPCNTASTWLAINENYISQNVSHQHHRHNICKVLKMQTKLLRLENFDILPQVERTVSNQIKQSISVIWSYVICSDDPRMAISHSYDHMSKGHMSTWSCWVIHRTCLWTQLGKTTKIKLYQLVCECLFLLRRQVHNATMDKEAQTSIGFTLALTLLCRSSTEFESRGCTLRWRWVSGRQTATLSLTGGK